MKGRRRAGQAMAIFAILLPLVLLPAAAYAVEATLLTTRSSILHAAVAQAAEDAVQAIDVSSLRAAGTNSLDPLETSSIAAATLAADDPRARLVTVTVRLDSVTVTACEVVGLAFGGFLGGSEVTLRGVATARLALGY